MGKETKISLKCKSCGSRNTKVVSVKELKKTMTTGGSQFKPVKSIALFNTVFMSLTMLFGWLKEKEKGNRIVLVCKDCGHWEEV